MNSAMLTEAPPGLYELDTVVAGMEAALPTLAPGPERWRLQSQLAWQLRERDTRQAQALAGEVLAALGPAAAPADRWSRLRCRLLLTLADAHRLYGELEAGEAMLAEARRLLAVRSETAAGMAALDRHAEIARADACWVQAQLQSAQGHTAACCAALGEAIEHARRARDATRPWLLEAQLARYAGLLDRRAAELRWGGHFPSDCSALHPTAAVLIELYSGYRALRASDFAGAIQKFSRAIAPLERAGCVREAIGTMVNLGGAFNELNDPESALAWMERALEMARRQGWPGSLSSCLLQMGETLRRLGRLDMAQSLLNEARQMFEPQLRSRNHAIALSYLGALALDLERPAEADALYAELESLGDFPDMTLSARLGRAAALLGLGRLDAATAAADGALAQAQALGAADLEIEARLVLARIARQRRARGEPAGGPDDSEPGSESGSESAIALQHLEAAQELAKSIVGYRDSAELLSALAQAYADVGRYQAAFETAQQAASARAVRISRESANRLEAIQLRHLSEGARTQAEHLRQLAEAERQKAALMQRNSATLEKLGLIGQELTQQLDMAWVFSALSRHIPALLDARAIEVYLIDAEGQALRSVFGLEDGQPLPHDRIALDDRNSNSARCARERRTLSVQLAADGSDPSQVPGTMRTLSALFAPLLIGERLLGVMTIQSPQAQAYDEHELMIFRTLSAYAAIALDNAAAYQRLQQTQSRLLAQEKLAALGALVAGVAHELNTPIGNSLLMASTLEQRSAAVERAMSDKSLRRQELQDYLRDIQAVARLLTQGLESAARLIVSFKQVGVDRTAEQRRRFELAELGEQVLATLQAGIRQRGHRLELDIPAGLALDSFPGPLGQVLSNLVNNAMLHGFGERRGGLMRLSARPLPQAQLEIRFQDDGVGIQEAHARRIFEPFFTTKFGQGGSGLGLSISHNIVHSLLGGSLSLAPPTAGPGCCFLIQLPLQAPLSEDEAQAGSPHLA